MNIELRKKILYRSTHRGCRENDWLLGKFVNTNIDKFSDHELSLLDQLLSENDPDIFSWLTQKSPSPTKYKELVKKIISFNEYTK